MTPDALTAGRVCAFALLTVELCDRYGATVTSWKRTPARNAAVGGRADSFHLEGLAADLETDDSSRAPALVKEARARGLDAVDEGGHVHIELDYRRHRG